MALVRIKGFGDQLIEFCWDRQLSFPLPYLYDFFIEFRYVDMPITDVLQMMGRAGRPQFDDHGVACVFVHDVKKHFYKKFLYEPFPVESSLLGVLPDHLNAEIGKSFLRFEILPLDGNPLKSPEIMLTINAPALSAVNSQNLIFRH